MTNGSTPTATASAEGAKRGMDGQMQAGFQTPVDVVGLGVCSVAQ